MMTMNTDLQNITQNQSYSCPQVTIAVNTFLHLKFYGATNNV